MARSVVAFRTHDNYVGSCIILERPCDVTSRPLATVSLETLKLCFFRPSRCPHTFCVPILSPIDALNAVRRIFNASLQLDFVSDPLRDSAATVAAPLGQCDTPSQDTFNQCGYQAPQITSFLVAALCSSSFSALIDTEYNDEEQQTQQK